MASLVGFVVARLIEGRYTRSTSPVSAMATEHENLSIKGKSTKESVETCTYVKSIDRFNLSRNLHLSTKKTVNTQFYYRIATRLDRKLGRSRRPLISWRALPVPPILLKVCACPPPIPFPPGRRALTGRPVALHPSSCHAHPIPAAPESPPCPPLFTPCPTNQIRPCNRPPPPTPASFLHLLRRVVVPKASVAPSPAPAVGAPSAVAAAVAATVAAAVRSRPHHVAPASPTARRTLRHCPP